MKTNLNTTKLRKSVETYKTEMERLLKLCQTEDDYDELMDIATDCICSAPRELVLTDFFDRQALRNHIDDMGRRADSDFINKVMLKAWSYDAITLDYDSCVQDFRDCVEEITKGEDNEETV